METSDMKNMLVLKNLPSNMVEEAIIIFKETQKVKEKEFVDKSNKESFRGTQVKSKDYVVKEAEILITDYINKIENKKSLERNRNTKTKYKILKYYSIISTVCLVISLIINFI